MCEFDRANTAEAGDLGIYGTTEGQECNSNIQCASDLRQRRYWGNLFGAQGYCELGRRDDTEVCKVAGKAGTKAKGVHRA